MAIMANAAVALKAERNVRKVRTPVVSKAGRRVRAPSPGIRARRRSIGRIGRVQNVHDTGDQVRLGRLDMCSNSPTIAKLLRSELPPYEMNGNVIPVKGIMRTTPPTMITV